jgi:hypothetical protein
MFDNPTVTPFEPNRERCELARLIQRIQALTVELQELRQRELEAAKFDAKEHTLEQLRRRLAAVARQTATDDLGTAA